MFIKFCFKVDKTAMEISDMIELAFVEETMSRTNSNIQIMCVVQREITSVAKSIVYGLGTTYPICLEV
jgi:hypothetical protein